MKDVPVRLHIIIIYTSNVLTDLCCINDKRSRNCESNTNDEDVHSQRRYKGLTANLNEDENTKFGSRKNYVTFSCYFSATYKHIINACDKKEKERKKERERT